MIEKPLRREPESREDVPLYKNCGLSVDARLKDLLSRMTLHEKVAQLVCIWRQKQTLLFDQLGTLDPNKLKQHLKNGVGRRHVQGGQIDSRQETATQDTL
jgi:beta-glucosidase